MLTILKTRNIPIVKLIICGIFFKTFIIYQLYFNKQVYLNGIFLIAKKLYEKPFFKRYLETLCIGDNGQL